MHDEYCLHILFALTLKFHLLENALVHIERQV